MSYDGSGTYSLPAGQPVVTGTTISSTTHNTLASDLATALSLCMTKDGQQTPTANLTMGTYKLTNLGAATAVSDAARASQVQDSSMSYLSSVSGADTITASASPTPAAYAAGQTFRFVSAGANTGAVTLNVSSLGAKAVTKDGSTALVAGDIPASAVVTVTYDGTRFQIVGTRPAIGVNIIDAKGDLIGGTAADTAARLAVGNDYQFLRGLASATTGLAWTGLLPAENVSTSATLTASQMNKVLYTTTDSATYTLPDLTAALDGSVVSLTLNAALTNGATLAPDASDSILDPATGTTGSVTIKNSGESVTVVARLASNRWYVIGKTGVQQRSVVSINSGSTTLSAGGTNYIGNSYANATETFCQFSAPYKCIARNLYTLAQSGQTGGQTTVYTLRVNAADTALTCTNSSGRNASDTTNAVAIAAGDLVSIKVVTSASATVCAHSATIDLERVT